MLRFDRELRDRYGRLLAYVYRDADGLFVNAQLVRDGRGADAGDQPEHRARRRAAALESGAQAAARGLWGACGAP